MILVTAWQMSQMDKKTIETYGIPGAVLMENAGRGATQVLYKKFGTLKDKKIGIIAGGGNNGGDGFVIARYLAHRNINTIVYLLSDKENIKGDAALNLDLLTDINVPVIEINTQKALLHHKSAMTNCDIWVDAIFGTGLNADVTGFLKSVIQFINSLDKPVLAVDIPSGLHPDTGQPLGTCIQADVTATFGFAKTGHITYPGMNYCGSIEIIDIGIPPHIAREALPSVHLLTPDAISATFKARPVSAHKGTTGHLLIIAGSKGKTGAAVLTAMAAMRSGAGLVTTGTPASQSSVLETMCTEAMTLPLPETKNSTLSKTAFEQVMAAFAGKKCIAIGPGIGTERQTAELVHRVVENAEIPVVIDADGLNCVAENPKILLNMKAPAILTPHPGEMARLTGKSIETIQKNRIKAAEDFAKKYKVILVLKGARTVIAHPDGEVFINPTGSPAMASGGMGDVLTGMISSFMTQDYSPAEAANAGVYLHGLIGESLAETIGPAGIIASDIISKIPAFIKQMAEGSLPPLKNINTWF